jgi:oligopeptide transport system substrate-binding protein
MQTDLHRRAELFQQAERLLIAEDAPIVPVYFYAGFTYFNPARIQGIFGNVLDEHPLQDIKKIR